MTDCPLCSTKLKYEGPKGGRYWNLHCNNCDDYYSTHTRDTGFFLHDRKTGNKVRRSRYRSWSIYQGDPASIIHTTPEQQQLEAKLKAEHQPQIIPSKEFHDLFCKTMREVSDRECTCYGKDLRQ